MSRQIIESIVAGDMIEANDMVEATLAQIRERKLYEMKRMFAAKMDEVFGGLSPEEIAQRKKAGYRKASDVLGDPAKEKMKAIPGHKFKKVKKKVAEAVDVQPDPQGKVRGGSGKSTKGSFKRKAAATAIRAVRKTARAAGTVGGEVAGRVSAARDIWKKYKAQKAQPSDADYARAAGAEPSHSKADAASSKRPNMLQRNINTLRGREPGYVDTRTPEEKLKTKGGKVGKVVRGTVKGVARGVGQVASDLASIGTSNLE